MTSFREYLEAARESLSLVVLSWVRPRFFAIEYASRESATLFHSATAALAAVFLVVLGSSVGQQAPIQESLRWVSIVPLAVIFALEVCLRGTIFHLSARILGGKAKYLQSLLVTVFIAAGVYVLQAAMWPVYYFVEVNLLWWVTLYLPGLIGLVPLAVALRVLHRLTRSQMVPFFALSVSMLCAIVLPLVWMSNEKGLVSPPQHWPPIASQGFHYWSCMYSTKEATSRRPATRPYASLLEVDSIIDHYVKIEPPEEKLHFTIDELRLDVDQARACIDSYPPTYVTSGRVYHAASDYLATLEAAVVEMEELEIVYPVDSISGPMERCRDQVREQFLEIEPIVDTHVVSLDCLVPDQKTKC